MKKQFSRQRPDSSSTLKRASSSVSTDVKTLSSTSALPPKANTSTSSIMPKPVDSSPAVSRRKAADVPTQGHCDDPDVSFKIKRQPSLPAGLSLLLFEQISYSSVCSLSFAVILLTNM